MMKLRMLFAALAAFLFTFVAARQARADIHCIEVCTPMIVVCQEVCWEDSDKPVDGVRAGVGVRDGNLAALFVNTSKKPITIATSYACNGPKHVRVLQGGKHVPITPPPKPAGCKKDSPKFVRVAPGKRVSIALGKAKGLQKGKAISLSIDLPFKVGGKTLTRKLRTSAIPWQSKWK
jgi:hypothetical protein